MSILAHSTNSRWILAFLMAMLFGGTVCLNGCYKPTVAPATTYNEEEAKLLKEELQKIEWE